ncbi:MAG: ROK family protein [Chloroflexota bacterium]
MLIGVDWGGTKIEIVAMAPDGTEHARLREDTPRGDYQSCIGMVAALVNRVEADVGRIERVGVGIPGSLDPQTGLGKGASSTWLMGQPVERDLREAMQRDVRVANDADLLAASEARDGAGAGYDVVFVANLASGVGAGIAFAGRAHHGANNSAAEWGHNPLPFASDEERPGRACYCGKHGCIETWVSGRDFERLFEEQAGQWVHGAEIARRARGGDSMAGAHLERYIDRVARGLSVVVNTLDPDILVIGGGMSNVDELYDSLPTAIGGYTFSSVFRTPIRKALHGDSSGVRGAAWLWADTP